MDEIKAKEPWRRAFQGEALLRSGVIASLSPEGWKAVERACGVVFSDDTDAFARILDSAVVVEITKADGEEISVWFSREG